MTFHVIVAPATSTIAVMAAWSATILTGGATSPQPDDQGACTHAVPVQTHFVIVSVVMHSAPRGGGRVVYTLSRCATETNVGTTWFCRYV